MCAVIYIPNQVNEQMTGTKEVGKNLLKHLRRSGLPVPRLSSCKLVWSGECKKVFDHQYMLVCERESEGVIEQT